jgi:hypothetical protein
MNQKQPEFDNIWGNWGNPKKVETNEYKMGDEYRFNKVEKEETPVVEDKIVLEDNFDELESESDNDNKGNYDKNTYEKNKAQLDKISLAFLNKKTVRYSETEMEAKFGTRGIKYLTKIDYDNVVKKLLSLGWKTYHTTGQYLLRIFPEFLDAKTGKFKTNERFRIEIQDLNYIQDYCKTNSIKIINDKSNYNVSINQKTPVFENDAMIQSANFDDFNFRVTLNEEKSISKNGKIGLEVFENWTKSKKTFRYLNRVTFIHEKYPFKIDLSIVKSSSRNEKGWFIQTYNIDESGVFTNPETYEIEIEVDYMKAKPMYRSSPQELSAGLQKVVTQVLSGLQKTNFPVSYFEQKDTIQNYYSLLFEEEYKKKNIEYVPKKNIYPSDFIGPSLVTLDIQNIAPLNPDILVPNITEPYAYCVTEKADGDRHLLYVNKTGRIYLINTNMSVIFTGARTREQSCFNSLLDGELILHNKIGLFINIFVAFDIYYIDKQDVRARPFINTHTKDEKFFEDGCRLPFLKNFVKKLNPEKIDMKKGQMKNSPITIIVKKFYPLFDSFPEEGKTKEKVYNIFEANNNLLRKIGDKNFDYEIDGLIFTPTLLGVGSDKFLEAGPKKKITWPYLFKWKPSEATAIFPKSYNTIDFLVITKKSPDGIDVITPVFENGVNNYESTQFNQYKTVILAVGFDPSKHGYINPCQDVLDDKYALSTNYDNEEGYKPKQFYPSDPFDPLAGVCNIMLELDSNGTFQMFTEERQVFSDQMVVEFRYDMSKPGLWKWIPMRIRYDKTAEFRAGNGVGANDYKTANNNWHSMHYPVTESMISSGEGIPGIEVSDDVYYNGSVTDKMTRGMRDFHNLYVKKQLINSVSKKSDMLIDLACGKAGDLPKWISSNLSFVFGIDISKDNIENRLNGACARYLNFKKTTKNMPYALFVNGNSALNIRSGTNMFTDKANQIVNAVFGKSSSDHGLGPAVTRQYSKARNGFDVTSCQFAMHYMFENKRTFYNFIRNVAECTKLNGYFIATCYDGRTVFNMLRKKEQGESEDIYVDDKKIWSITKQYDAAKFDDNESCLGYKIDVYQDTINQSIPEYLVNFDFLTTTMDKYGFTLLTKEETKQMKLPESSGMFSELYRRMEEEVNKYPKKQVEYKEALYMKDYEKKISFLNRYFVYKKKSTLNVEKLTNALLDQLPGEYEIEEIGEQMAKASIKEVVPSEIGKKANAKAKVKKLVGKLRLIEATEALEEQPQPQPQAKKKTTRKKRAPILNIVE